LEPQNTQMRCISPIIALSFVEPIQKNLTRRKRRKDRRFSVSSVSSV